MNMREKEQDSLLQITMHMRCWRLSVMQRMYIIIARESGIRSLTVAWQWISLGIILPRSTKICTTN